MSDIKEVAIQQGSALDNAILVCLLLRLGRAVTLTMDELREAIDNWAGTVNITDSETHTVLIRLVTKQEGEEIQMLHSMESQGKPS